MPRHPSYDLEIGAEESLEHHAKSYLAIVDLETYPPYISGTSDYLDVLSHLCGEVEALHAVMWETPSALLKLRLLLTEESRLSTELLRTHRLVFDGCVRTMTGQLCLTDDEELLAASRHSKGDLLRGKALSQTRTPHVLHVPPGVISVGVFCERLAGVTSPELRRARVDYTILMRRYPLPPPRVAPVRLTGGLIPWVGEGVSAQPWGAPAQPTSARGAVILVEV